MFFRPLTTADFFRCDQVSLRAVVACLVVVATMLPGCAHHPAKTAANAATQTPKPIAKVKAKPAPPARTIEPAPNTPEQRLGTVRVVGARGSFVLIETPSASVTAAVPTGYLLHCRPAGVVSGASSADLRVSPERRQPFVVADVLAGTPAIGDVAYLAKDGGMTPGPVVAPVVPYSSILPAAAPPTATPAANP